MNAPPPPVARKQPHRTEQLGRVRTDDYAWMKDENWQKVMRDPAALRADIRAHLEAENAYTKAMLAPTEALQATLFEEMKGRIKADDSSLPQPDGPCRLLRPLRRPAASIRSMRGGPAGGTTANRC